VTGCSSQQQSCKETRTQAGMQAHYVLATCMDFCIVTSIDQSDYCCSSDQFQAPDMPEWVHKIAILEVCARTAEVPHKISQTRSRSGLLPQDLERERNCHDLSATRQGNFRHPMRHCRGGPGERTGTPTALTFAISALSRRVGDCSPRFGQTFAGTVSSPGGLEGPARYILAICFSTVPQKPIERGERNDDSSPGRV